MEIPKNQEAHINIKHLVLIILSYLFAVTKMIASII